MVLGTPNTSGAIGKLYGVIFHGSRSGIAAYSHERGDGSEGKHTLSYVRTPGTTSYNWLIDYDGTIYELAGWDLQAWHAGSRDTKLHMNTNWYGCAFAQVDTWESITAAQHASARWLVGQIGKRTGIPHERREYVSGRYATHGYTEHRLTAQGQSSGKSDVGTPALNWTLLGF